MNNEKDELFLCKPCAEEMKDYKTVEEIEYVRPARDKGTCEQCNRRRYGYVCNVKYTDPEELTI